MPQEKPLTNEEIKKLVQTEIQNSIQAQVLKFLFHNHNGTDGSPQLDPVNLKPFPVYTVIPTDASPNGTFKLVYDGTNYRLYFRLNSLWKYVALS